MENTENTDPIDDQITNDDNSVTNKDGDNNLEQGEQTPAEPEVKATDIPTATPGKDHDESLADASKTVEEQPAVVKGEQSPVEKGENTSDASNKGQGPKGENL